MKLSYASLFLSYFELDFIFLFYSYFSKRLLGYTKLFYGAISNKRKKIIKIFKTYLLLL